MDVYWLEQAESDVPVENHWLSAGEAARLEALHIAKRRVDWRLGRWAAKRAVAAYLDVPRHLQSLANIEIRPAPSKSLSSTHQRPPLFRSATATVQLFVRSPPQVRRWVVIWSLSSLAATPLSPTISRPKSKRWLRECLWRTDLGCQPCFGARRKAR